MKYLYKENIWYHKAREEFRYWLHWGKTIWHYEGYLGKKANHTMLGLDLGGEENDFTFKLGIKGLFGIYFGVEDLLPRKFMRKLFGYDGRIYEISAYEEYLCFDFHRDENGYSEGWRGIHWMFNWKEKLYGKWEYKCDVVETVQDFVKMPEGNYPATITIKNVSRGYKRSKKQLTKEFEVELDIPIPFEGKGETGYDLDEDGLWSSNLLADSLEDALQKVKESTLKTRIKRGGLDWKPKNGWKVQEL